MITFDNRESWKRSARNILEMSRIHPALWQILHALKKELDAEGLPFRVTAVFYPPGSNGSTSMTHPEFRAVDVGGLDLAGREITEERGRLIENRVNRRHQRDDMKRVVFHRGSQDGVFHFHCQVPRDGNVRIDLEVPTTG